MKPVAFDYERPRTIAEAVRLLSGNPDAKMLAGGQTLGPMLNLRLVQPSLILDITRIPELTRVEEDGRAVVLGACVTHAAIEDKRITDPSNGFLAEVAQRHCLSRRAHPRHDRRQPRPCRSGRRLALLPRAL